MESCYPYTPHIVVGLKMKSLSSEERISLIEDRNAILDLEADYAATWDFGDAAGWANLYTEDGIFEMVSNPATPAIKAQGHSALAEFCTNVHLSWKGLHFMHPPKITLEVDRATALIFFQFRHVMQTLTGHGRQGSTAGYYRVDYVRTTDGWRIQKRVETGVFEDTQQSFTDSL